VKDLGGKKIFPPNNSIFIRWKIRGGVRMGHDEIFFAYGYNVTIGEDKGRELGGGEAKELYTYKLVLFLLSPPSVMLGVDSIA
jgi:hypothetical protein